MRAKLLRAALVAFTFAHLVLVPATLEAQRIILVKGSVIDALAPNRSLPDVVVFIEVAGNSFRAAYTSDQRGNLYEHRLPLSYINRPISVRSVHPTYFQTEEVTFEPGDGGIYTKPLILKHKENIAEDHYQRALELRRDDRLVDALQFLDASLEAYPQPRTYRAKILYLGELVKGSLSAVPRDLLLTGEAMALDEKFQRLPRAVKFDLYSELGLVLSRASDLSFRVDNATSLFDLALDAYDKAIALNPAHAEPYQGRYRLQFNESLYVDGRATIAQFFKANPQVQTELTIKTFLSDWVTSIENTTSFPAESERQYRSVLDVNPSYRQAWQEVLTFLERHSAYFAGGTSTVDIRLSTALDRARRFSQVTEEP